ncbi:MAG: MBL fold metallo-hydrolase RNA specificity domain-containing protein [candidate division WOR-3 bacterium]
MATRLHILDGARTIGGTKMVLEEDRRGVILDFGLNYARFGLFFEEFLKPRAPRGLLDYILTGLLPPYRDLYRDDLFIDHPGLKDMPDLGIKIEAALFSHPHFDHTGLAGFLRDDIPFYGSPGCALTTKASQDVQSDKMEKEIAYTKPRCRREWVVKIPKNKGEGEKLAIWRPWRVFADEVSDEFMGFWRDLCLSDAKPEPTDAEPVGTDFRAGPFRIRSWPVDHSAPGAVAFGIETSAGWIVYTGDIRFHGYAGGKTERFVEEAAKLSPIKALLIEGTRVGESGTMSEEDVFNRAFEVVRAANGKGVNAEFPLRHPQRLITFARAAVETGRRLVLMPQDYYTASAIAVSDPELNEALEDVLIYQDEKSNPKGWERSLFKRFPEKMVTPQEITRNIGDYLLSFRYWVINRLLDIPGFAGGIHIYSTSEPHSEEQEWDLERLRRWLEFFGITMIGDPEADPRDPLHASGHASGDELIRIIEALSPKEVIPIHTENWGFFKENVKCCSVREPGEVVEL